MVSKNLLITLVIGMVIVIIVSMNIAVNFSQNTKEKRLFPDIIGDSVLRKNDTGIYYIKSIISYDNFKGNIIQGYKANYSGINGTAIIFVAQMQDNATADKSIKEMIILNGYNESNANATIDENATVIKIPVNNPEVFVIQKNNDTMWHYTYAKLDKVYWIGFSDSDISYQTNMLMEIYRKVDNEDESNTNI